MFQEHYRKVIEWKDYIQESTSDYYELNELVVAKILFYHDTQWIQSGLVGGLSIGTEKTLNNAPVFIMFDLNTYEIIFKMELYFDFLNAYRKFNETIYGFQLPKCQTYLAFSFTNKEDALQIQKQVQLFSQEIEKHYQQYQQTLSENNKVLNAEDEKKRFENTKLKKQEIQIIKNAGITKKQFQQDKNLQNIVFSAFLKIRLDKQTKEQAASEIGGPITNQFNDQFKSKSAIQQKSNLKSFESHQLDVQTNLIDLQKTKKSNNMIQLMAQQVPMPQESSTQILNKVAHNNPPPPLDLLLKMHGQDNKAPPSLDNLKQNFNTKNNQQSLDHNQNKQTNMQPANNNDRNDLMKQIQNKDWVLKHREPQTKAQEFNKKEQIGLQAHLAGEIHKRGQQMRKNYLDDEDEELSPWDSDSN